MKGCIVAVEIDLNFILSEGIIKNILVPFMTYLAQIELHEKS